MSRQSLLRWVADHVYKPIEQFKIEVAPYKGNVAFSDLSQQTFHPINIGQSWGTLFDRAWFRLSIKNPPSIHDKPLVLMVDVGGEGLVYDNLGNALMGLTNKQSSYGIPPDKPGKWIVHIPSTGPYEYYVDASCNDLFGFVQQGGLIQNAHLGMVDFVWHQLYYDLEVLCDWESGLGETGSHHPSTTNRRTSYSRRGISPLLDQIQSLVDLHKEAALNQIRVLLNEFYARPSNENSLYITATGHAHLDIAWMWPISEGRRKAQRTFATALTMMDRYPQYVFGASQYQLFDWIRQDDPGLFKKIQHQVAKGRFELQGCFWVECDLNLPSLESLIRQIHYGQEFIQTYFRQQVRYVWEPDVFGLSGALPQILIKSGVPVICSQKLSQNRINPFPYHSFKWEGIDGSTVLVHHFPEETYDSRMRAASVLKLVDQYKEKKSVPEALMVFGVGDGGGGPGEEHLERFNRIHNVKELPKIHMGRVDEFIHRWSTYESKMEIIKGELYFERHQGTYTTEVLNKIGNQTMERLLREFELLSSFLFYLTNQPIPQTYLDEVWKEVLLYQFHDILPGSSFMPVYHETRMRYQCLIADLSARVDTLFAQYIALTKTKGLIGFNPTGFLKKDWVCWNHQWYYAETPPLSYQTLPLKPFRSFPIQKNQLDNGIVRVLLDDAGTVTSIVDLATGFEYIDASRTTSMFTIYHERAQEYPAWDFADGYRAGRKGHPRVVSIRNHVDGPMQEIIITYAYQTSTWTLHIRLFEGSPLIKMVCEMDWHEVDTSVKLHWPITIRSDHATCHLQYGQIARPTHSRDSYAFAKDEIYAHQFVDISNSERGIALLSPQKYGFRVKDQSLEVTLLRTQKKYGSELGFIEDPNYPEHHFGDLVSHSFELGLLIHEGTDLLYVQTMAEHLQNPIKVIEQNKEGVEGFQNPFILSDDYVVIHAIKPAYDHQGLILRIVELSGTARTFSFMTKVNYKALWLCDMQEKKLQVVDSKNILIKGFEVLTLKLII